MTLRIALTTLLIWTIAAVTVSGAKINEQWSVTFTERFRLVTWDNAVTLDETIDGSRAFTRHRTQLGAVWSPTPVLSVGFRLGNEFRYYAEPADRDFDLNEVFVDQLYLKVNQPWNTPLTLTIGRQNIMLGEGFVVMDGHPLDGSRSIYFNAVRFDWALRANHLLTGFASVKEETDDWLPIVNSQDQALVEQPETGLGLYYSGSGGKQDYELYYIYKTYEESEAFPFDASTHTLGGRYLRKLLRLTNLLGVMEFAYQWGGRAELDREGMGLHTYVQYHPPWRSHRFYLPTETSAGVIALSGDDPETATLEDWDPVFARWPKWSESYIYTQIQEAGVARWTNLASLYAQVEFHLSSHVDLRFDYHRLYALQEDAAVSEFPGGDGTVRGDLLIGRLSFAFDDHWSGHLLWEGFAPGDYYFDGADSYAWIRAEMMFRY